MTMTAPNAARTPTESDVAEFRSLHARVAEAVEVAVQGKRVTIELILVAMFAGGHVLLEDVPGTGKTTLARSLAAALGGRSRRIQFTPDLLPSDVTGTSVFDPRSGEVSFRSGPVFAHVVLADEINRAAAKTQSALLEVMEERTVTVDGVPHSVPDPFLVVATQNPIDLDGTYRLPEAQLDRFMICTALGYPDVEDEIEVLRPGATAGSVDDVPAVTTPELVAAQTALLSRVHVAEPILRYVRSIGAGTRNDERLKLGVSTRGLRVLVRCSQVYAAAQGRHYVVPSDVQHLVRGVLAHRIQLTRASAVGGLSAADVLADIVGSVDVPRPSAS